MANPKKHYFIKCLNEEIHGKGGKIIGEVEMDNLDAVSYLDLQGLLSMRKRFDGNWGCECICGNDSRLAASEKGLIGRTRPSPDALKQIAKNMADPKKQAKTKETKDYIEVDGFQLVKADGK